MQRKFIWLVTSCLVALSLVLAACAPATPTETKEAPKEAAPKAEAEVTPKAEVVTKEEVAATVEKPKYGGVVTYALSSAPRYFDSAFSVSTGAHTINLTHDVLINGDWAQGPAGTNQTGWNHIRWVDWSLTTGAVAESWELTDPVTLTYRIRKGIRFALNPKSEASKLVNGREIDANDVVFSLMREWNGPTSYLYTSYRGWAKSVTATDKWTVVAQTDSADKTGRFHELNALFVKIVPREVIEKYGNLGDWRNAVGTGPFMLTDYVDGSVATFIRNPNYWMTDPVGPGKGNQLPYADGLKMLFILDPSTALAALRTGKIDQLGSSTGLLWDDARSLLQTNPELKYLEYVGGSTRVISWRLDKPELPWYDLRVRRALRMAVDLKAILKGYYGDHGILFAAPVTPIPEFIDMYVPLEELPESTRELYEYHPDKAKQLLTEAGYPNGFKAEIVTLQTDVDWVSIIQDYWASIGVDLSISVKESGAFGKLRDTKGYGQMMTHGITGVKMWTYQNYKAGNIYNVSVVNDPIIEDNFVRQGLAYWDQPKRHQIFREMIPHLLSQAYELYLPEPSNFVFWQPWVKNYHGEITLSYMNAYNWPIWVWVDRDLKEKMTGRR